MNPKQSNREIEVVIERKRLPRRLRRSGEPELPPAPRIPRITRLMALAIRFQEMIDCGEVKDYADLARLGHVSRARITQIMNLLNLAPQIQEALLLPIRRSDDCARVSEHDLRAVTRTVVWQDQISAFEARLAA